MKLKNTIANALNNFLKTNADSGIDNDYSYVNMLNGQLPIFSSFGNDIYASDVVLQAIYKIIDEMTKLDPLHIRRVGHDYTPVEGAVQSVLDNPNFLMTFPEFISKYMFNLLVTENSFVYKQYNGKRLIAMYPLSPTEITFLEDVKGELYYKFRFISGYEVTLPFNCVIHDKNHYTVNDLMGGNEFGQPNTEPILETVRLNDILLQGLRKALQISFNINGFVKYNTMLDKGKMATDIKEFEKKLLNNESGILGLDMKNEFIQMKRDIKLIDEPTLRFIDDKILRNWNTPIEIIRGNAAKEVIESWYQLCLEPYIIRISKKWTQSIFTERESGFKNEIKLFPKELIFASMQDTIAMINLLAPSGTLLENEKRVPFGLPPLKELEGIRMMSLNWVNAEIAKEYQLQNVKEPDKKLKEQEEPVEEKENEEEIESD